MSVLPSWGGLAGCRHWRYSHCRGMCGVGIRGACRYGCYEQQVTKYCLCRGLTGGFVVAIRAKPDSLRTACRFRAPLLLVEALPRDSFSTPSIPSPIHSLILPRQPPTRPRPARPHRALAVLAPPDLQCRANSVAASASASASPPRSSCPRIHNMAAVHANGANGVNGAGAMFPPPRYSDVPSSITISVADDEGGQLDVEIPLDDQIQDDPTELCDILEAEKSATSTWVQVAVAYAKHRRIETAIDVLKQATDVFSRARADDRLSILNGLCWLYLLKCREAPRVRPRTWPALVSPPLAR